MLYHLFFLKTCIPIITTLQPTKCSETNTIKNRNNSLKTKTSMPLMRHYNSDWECSHISLCAPTLLCGVIGPCYQGATTQRNINGN